MIPVLAFELSSAEREGLWSAETQASNVQATEKNTTSDNPTHCFLPFRGPHLMWRSWWNFGSGAAWAARCKWRRNGSRSTLSSSFLLLWPSPSSFLNTSSRSCPFSQAYACNFILISSIFCSSNSCVFGYFPRFHGSCAFWPFFVYKQTGHGTACTPTCSLRAESGAFMVLFGVWLSTSLRTNNS